jgi:probable F420-dependent oxidoreductase
MTSTAQQTPQLSITLITFAADDPGGWEHVLERARIADAAGVDRLVVSDHVCYGEDLEAYADPKTGGTVGGKQPTGPDGHWLDPLTVLSVVAGQTKTIRLGTNILIAALRRPVVLAKTTSTLDVLSGGRLDLGVGVGWQRQEYEAAGLDFDGRGRLLDHTLEVLQLLWTEQRAQYSSPELSFEKIHQMPKPLQAGGVPIWVSGTVNARVARRLVRFGSNWIPWGPAMRDVPSGIAQMRELVAAEGGDLSTYGIVGSLPVVKDGDGNADLVATMDGVPALAEAGITDFRSNLPIPADPSEAADRLGEVVAAFRKAVGRS